MGVRLLEAAEGAGRELGCWVIGAIARGGAGGLEQAVLGCPRAHQHQQQQELRAAEKILGQEQRGAGERIAGAPGWKRFWLAEWPARLLSTAATAAAAAAVSTREQGRRLAASSRVHSP